MVTEKELSKLIQDYSNFKNFPATNKKAILNIPEPDLLNPVSRYKIITQIAGRTIREFKSRYDIIEFVEPSAGEYPITLEDGTPAKFSIISKNNKNSWRLHFHFSAIVK